MKKWWCFVLATVFAGLAPLVLFAPQQHAPPQQDVKVRLPRARAVATPLHAASSHALPFAIYHMFCAARDGCATVEIVGQLEGACDARRAVLERALLDEWPAWRRELVRSHPDCQGCVASKLMSKVKGAVANAISDHLDSRGALQQFWCGFRESGVLLNVTASSEVPAKARKFKSTVVTSCDVPRELRAGVAAGSILVAVGPSPSSWRGAHPALRVVVQQNVNARVGACVWTKGGSYKDRVGNDQPLPSARVVEWLAIHMALGVEHFAVFDNSDGVYAAAVRERREWQRHSPLWDALEPLVDAGVATHVPWPTLIADEVTDDCATAELEARVKNATATFGIPKTTQSFFGRPSQYAAQNACHRRLVAAGVRHVLHVDVDEFVVPRNAQGAPARDPRTPASPDAPLQKLARHYFEESVAPPAALAMPCVFYAPCNGSKTIGASGGILLDDATCAGKANMYRQKLLADKTARARAFATRVKFQCHARSLGPLRPRGRRQCPTHGSSAERRLCPRPPTPRLLACGPRPLSSCRGQSSDASRTRSLSGYRRPSIPKPRVHGRCPIRGECVHADLFDYVFPRAEAPCR